MDRSIIKEILDGHDYPRVIYLTVIVPYNIVSDELKALD